MRAILICVNSPARIRCCGLFSSCSQERRVTVRAVASSRTWPVSRARTPTGFSPCASTCRRSASASSGRRSATAATTDQTRSSRLAGVTARTTSAVIAPFALATARSASSRSRPAQVAVGAPTVRHLLQAEDKDGIGAGLRQMAAQGVACGPETALAVSMRAARRRCLRVGVSFRCAVAAVRRDLGITEDRDRSAVATVGRPPSQVTASLSPHIGSYFLQTWTAEALIRLATEFQLLNGASTGACSAGRCRRRSGRPTGRGTRGSGHAGTGRAVDAVEGYEAPPLLTASLSGRSRASGGHACEAPGERLHGSQMISVVNLTPLAPHTLVT